jgi:acetyltransferase
MRSKVDKIFRPKSIVIIGASEREGARGTIVLRNLLEASFKGDLYAVNLKHEEVQGLPVYRSVRKIDGKIDLAIICSPAETVLQVVKECGEAGVGGLLILSSGFKMEDDIDQLIIEKISLIARKYGMRILGPNCLGFLNPRLNINASITPKMALPGNIAFITQSGALATSVLDWSVDQKVGFSYFVHLGAPMDIGFADLIDYFGADPFTSCILIYMENLQDARRFMSASRAFSRNKPIIILKAGKSQEGKEAALTHTGVLTGDDHIFQAAFDRVGLIRVDMIAQLFNCAKSLARQPRPKGNRLAVVSNAGGPGVLATDYLINNGGALSPLSDLSLNRLNELLPPNWSKTNPIDLLSTATPEQYAEAVKLCIKDSQVDGVLVILTPTLFSDPVETATKLVKLAKKCPKPILASWMGESGVREGRAILENGGIPNYRFPESAVDVFVRMYKYNQDLQSLYDTVPATPQSFTPDRKKARNIIYYALEHGRKALFEHEAKRLFQCYDLPVAPCLTTRNMKEVLAFAEEIGYPVVLKIVSQDIAHKSDVDGVVLNVQSPEEAKEAFRNILNNVNRQMPEARIEGILVEKMFSKKYELLFGAHKDPLFGPILFFGQGGVAAEALKDFSLGLPPLNMSLAKKIIEKTRIYSLLKGYKHWDEKDFRELEFTLCKFAYLVMDFPEILEVEINPFGADKDGGQVIDAHVVLDTQLPIGKTKMYNHLAISPYPGRKYSREAIIKDGRKILLRPIMPEDEPLLIKMLEHASSQSLYLRFFGHVPKVTHKWLTRFTHIDYDRENAIVAEITHEDQTKELMGVVRIIEDAWGESAEYAILVADKWQGQHLGNLLTDYILEIAKERDIKKIVASVLPTNSGMVHMFEKRGFSIDKSSLEAYEVSLELR